MPDESILPFAITPCDNLKVEGYDGIVVVCADVTKLKDDFQEVKKIVGNLIAIDKSAEREVNIIPSSLPGGRVVYAPTGPVNRDEDDIRRFAEAAHSGVKKALKAGLQAPILALQCCDGYENACLVSLLGAMQALYVHIQVREDAPDRKQKVKKLGIWCECKDKAKNIVKLAQILESGRIVCRDIGAADPERMAPPKVEEYVKKIFTGTSVKVEVIADRQRFVKEYPLFAAVDRAASGVERHRGRLITLTYVGEGPIEDTVMLVGKGVTYDTGGADIKAGGVMAGMSRDKCGAASVAGFFKVLADLKPKHVKAIGRMCMVRNSVGEECYVSDEYIVARSGKRVCVGNTDAEGRMAMADSLCEMKEIALKEVNPHIMTIATLTGHSVLTVGQGYTIVMDNGPARKEKFAQSLQEFGDQYGDMFEISTIRREDYAQHIGRTEDEDLYQANNNPSVRTPRGHQAPSAFMIMAAGLDKHGIDSDKPIKYSHLDCAGSSGILPEPTTGSTVIALAMRFSKGRFTE